MITYFNWRKCTAESSDSHRCIESEQFASFGISRALVVLLPCTVIKRKEKADTSRMINYSYPIIKANTHMTYGLTNQSLSIYLSYGITMCGQFES